jgi:hypothetical protein
MRMFLTLLLCMILQAQADDQFLAAWGPITARVFDYVESTGNAASATSNTIQPSAHNLYFVCVVVSDSAAISCTGVTGNSLTWVQVGTNRDFNQSGTPLSEITVWRSSGLAPSSGTISAAFSATSDSHQMAVIEVQNAKVTGSSGADGIKQATDGTPANAATTLTLTAGAAISSSLGNMMIAFYGADINTGFTAESGWIELLDDTINTPTGAMGIYVKTDGTDNSSAITCLSADWAGIIAEVDHR